MAAIFCCCQIQNLGTLGKNVVIDFLDGRVGKMDGKVSGLITRHMCSALEIRFPVLTLSSGAEQRLGWPDICLKFRLNEPLRCLIMG